MYARAQAAAASRPRRAASLRAEPPRTTHVRRDAAARAHSSISALPASACVLRHAGGGAALICLNCQQLPLRQGLGI
ncbi:unnamed protein product [Plutella xylostella]|uniref:(diamondback moth) hypothetical protein n=1 Tax=Plutella xylostella TaxID=51655 RepID=A0A8S4G0X9_PLUXY|nr:unnamed protein product [Plutella xylostella]